MRTKVILLVAAAALRAQDAREIVRKSVQVDQANWSRAKDYTWVARDDEKRLDPSGRMKSEEVNSWETLILYGEPYRRMLTHNGRPLTPDEQRKEQQKLDQYTAKLASETPEQRANRVAKFEEQRRKDREFLLEIPEAYDFKLEGADTVDGRAVWVISGTPRAGYKPKRRDAGALLKVRAKLWVDQAEYQWVRLEAETISVISYGLILARLDPGAKLVFEQTRVNDEVWLPKRQWMRGSGRIGLVKRLAMEEEITWSNYRKFQAESKIVQ